MHKKGAIQYYSHIYKEWVYHSGYDRKREAKKYLFCIKMEDHFKNATAYRIRRNKKQAPNKHWDAIF